MSGRRNLFDALPEWARTPANVKDLGLIQRNFYSARSDKIGCCMDICKGSVHRLFPPLQGAIRYSDSVFSLPLPSLGYIALVSIRKRRVSCRNRTRIAAC